MARLAIAEDFLAEYANLDRDVQGALDAAIAKFARHAQRRLHLKKPQYSRDARIWIIRLHDRWHGVFVAPAADETDCLVTVLLQDKANAYATTHRYSGSPAVGVLEARGEEAIHQLQRSFQAVADPNGKQLFADVSDDELTPLGIDAQILPTVGLLNGESDLERLQTVLPEPQYAACHALVGGMTVDEVAWLLSADTPPEQVNRDDRFLSSSALQDR